LAEPLLAGIYNAESDRQSLLATFPRFRQLEKEHGSLIRGMLAAQQKRAASRSSAESENEPLAMFISFQRGMGELITALDNALTGDRCLNSTVSALQPHDGRYRLVLNGGESQLEADAVLLAIPAYAAAALLQPFAPDAAAQLSGIRYVSTGTISLGYSLDEIEQPLDGFGLVIPHSEQRSINAITWTSTKFDCRAPQGHALLRVFFGGSRRPEMMDVDDNTLLAIVRRELEQLLGITATPLFHRIYRWHNANPQYDVGHLQRVSAIEAALPAGVYVSGSPYRGVGIPDCVHQAQRTVHTLLAERTLTPG
jgi:oxygen-dependent protoporphyrinogen oxidase